MGNYHHTHCLGHDHHHHHVPKSINSIFIFCVVLNLLFVLFEAGTGFYYNSVGLLSDAGHNMGDVFSLLLVLIAFRMAKSNSNNHFTYGYKKGTILISVINAVILLVAVGAIVIESMYRLKHPSPVSGLAISWTAGIGIIINGVTTWLLMRGRKDDLNIQGAFLHMLTDTLVSVGVVISGILISLKNWVWIDPIISLVIAIIILVSTFRLLKESLCLSLDGVPESVNLNEVRHSIDQIPHIDSWHHLHVWAISTTENAATLHVVLNDLTHMKTVKEMLKERFTQHGISHCTIECETTDEKCKDQTCGI